MSERLEDALAIRAHAQQLHSAAAVGRALDCMAEAIGREIAERNPLVVAVMQGGVFAAVELCRRFEFPHEFDYVHLTRYGHATVAGATEWLVRPKSSWRGRCVLLVDDILDRGVTLAVAAQEFQALPVGQLFTAVLVRKRISDPDVQPAVDFVGLDIDDRYVFGSGLDYRGYWRSLPGLYAAD
jgi:hypoxanthine phosphoribosyltransferase